MPGLAETLSRLKQFRAAFEPGAPVPSGRLAPLSFTPNPGALDARCYIPPGLAAGAPLVVVLHGCTQTADRYDHGSGWSLLAERHGFALLYPQQRRENNANLCFNWFVPEDVRRDCGEVASIAAMVETMVDAHGLDWTRIFVTGLSAGGAMTAALLATYPDLFAAGTIIAGLPFGVAHSVPQAFQAMRGSGGHTAHELGDLVRAAAPPSACLPRIAVWQGRADHTVAASNADAIVAQWLDVHGLPNRPSDVETLGAATHRAWRDGGGRTLVESFDVAEMGNGVPLDPASNADEIAGPFLLDVGISASAHSLQAWGIAAPDASAAPARERLDVPTRPTAPAAATGWSMKAPPRKPAAGGDNARPFDVGGIINDALRAAGLMK